MGLAGVIFRAGMLFSLTPGTLHRLIISQTVVGSCKEQEIKLSKALTRAAHAGANARLQLHLENFVEKGA